MKNRIITAVLAATMILSFAACGNKDIAPEITDDATVQTEKVTDPVYSTDKELYEHGIEVVDIMLELTRSEKYGELIGARNLENAKSKVDSTNFDISPAVYKVDMQDIESLLNMHDPDLAAEYSVMSDVLREQIENKFGFSSVVGIFNIQMGNECVAYSSCYTAVKTYEDIRLEEDVVYLFDYEGNVSVVLTFGRFGMVNGQFLFGNDNIIETIKSFGIDVTRVTVG